LCTCRPYLASREERYYRDRERERGERGRERGGREGERGRERGREGEMKIIGMHEIVACCRVLSWAQPVGTVEIHRGLHWM